jgi:hypothetical protein
LLQTDFVSAEHTAASILILCVKVWLAFSYVSFTVCFLYSTFALTCYLQTILFFFFFFKCLQPTFPLSRGCRCASHGVFWAAMGLAWATRGEGGGGSDFRKMSIIDVKFVIS